MIDIVPCMAVGERRARHPSGDGAVTGSSCSVLARSLRAVSVRQAFYSSFVGDSLQVPRLQAIVKVTHTSSNQAPAAGKGRKWRTELAARRRGS